MTAALLRSLHVPGRPLLLPNAWDAASARLVSDAGFPVVATSSSAVADVLGYPDGNVTPPDEVFAAVARITRVVSVPVTVDVEGGYGLDADELAERLLESGAVGANLEDTDHRAGGLVALDAQAARLADLREAAGDGLVINARVDSFLRAEGQEAALPDAVERARAYLAAGADCVYPILVRDPAVLAAFTEAVAPAAVNATRLPDGPSLATLAELGIARISAGGGLWATARAAITRELAEFWRERR